MGLHLVSGALNQAALARDRARAAALCWGLAACAFLAWMFTPTISNELTRTEVGYAGATGLLALLLWALYRQGSGSLAHGPRKLAGAPASLAPASSSSPPGQSAPSERTIAP